MPSFYVKSDRLSSDSAILEKYSVSLNSYADDIRSVDLSSLSDSIESRIRQTVMALGTSTEWGAQAMRNISSGLGDLSGLYRDTEYRILGKNLRDDVMPDPEGSKDGDTDVFDGDGMYGGDQGYFKTVDDDFCDWVREHPGFEDMTNDEIKAMMNKFAASGCNWTAAGNMIFAEFYGREEEFENLFGFPMYDESGEFNYGMLISDMFLTTHGMYYFGRNDIYSREALRDSLVNYYRENPTEFENAYGYNPLDSNGKLTSQALAAITGERDQMIRNMGNGNELRFENDPYALGTNEFPNRINHYLNEKGITGFEYQSATTYTNAQITNALDDGKNVIICAKDFSLYDPITGTETRSGVGAHAMVVTGVTEDGNYIVSSWGQQFIYKLGDNDTYHSAIMDINSGNGNSNSHSFWDFIIPWIVFV